MMTEAVCNTHEVMTEAACAKLGAGLRLRRRTGRGEHEEPKQTSPKSQQTGAKKASEEEKGEFKKTKSPRVDAVATCLHHGCGAMAACMNFAKAAATAVHIDIEATITN